MSEQNKYDKKLDIRITRPTFISGVFGNLFQTFHRPASINDLTARWDEIMGPDIASIAKLVAIKKTRDNKYSVIIKPANTALALQLSYANDEILRRINKYFGYPAISKITYKK